MPPEFFGERIRRSPDFWLPLSFHPQVDLRKSFLDDNNVYWLMMIGRLKPGVKIEQAQSNVNLALRQFSYRSVGLEAYGGTSTRNSEYLRNSCSRSRRNLGTAIAIFKTVANADGNRGHGSLNRLRQRRQSFCYLVQRRAKLNFRYGWRWAQHALASFTNY
jgi:hypothetical protein